MNLHILLFINHIVIIINPFVPLVLSSSSNCPAFLIFVIFSALYTSWLCIHLLYSVKSFILWCYFELDGTEDQKRIV